MINTITIPIWPQHMVKINSDSQYKVLLHPTTRSQLCTDDRIRIQKSSSNINNNNMNWTKNIMFNLNQEWFKSQCTCKCLIIKVNNTTIMTNSITNLKRNTSNSTAHNMATTALDMSSHSSGIRNFGNSLPAKLVQQRMIDRSFTMTIAVILNTLLCTSNSSIESSSPSTRFVLLTEWVTNSCSWIISSNCV